MKLPTVQEEAIAATGKNGYYIPPCRMAEIAKTAQRMLSILSGSNIQMSYAECDIVLEIIQQTLEHGRGK